MSEQLTSTEPTDTICHAFKTHTTCPLLPVGVLATSWRILVSCRWQHTLASGCRPVLSLAHVDAQVECTIPAQQCVGYDVVSTPRRRCATATLSVAVCAEPAAERNQRDVAQLSTTGHCNTSSCVYVALLSHPQSTRHPPQRSGAARHHPNLDTAACKTSHHEHGSV